MRPNTWAKAVVKTYFKDDAGKPFEMTPGQCEIFNSIYLRAHNRVQVTASTQYGKSTIVAMALILRSQAFRESWAIVTGQEAKSQIIMEKVIQHTFDSRELLSRLEIEANEPLDRIRRERSKKRVTWKGGGEIRTFTADSRNKMRVKESLSGFGSKNIVEDEAALIQDDLQAMVLRMLGGHKDNFLMKIGNPFYRNHFLKTWQSSKYKKIYIDYKQALLEGRYTAEFIEEMKAEPLFDVLYECKFPRPEEVDIKGFRYLIKEEDLKQAKGVDLGDNLRLGVDIGRGGDYSAFVLRGTKGARLLEKNQVADLMYQVTQIKKYKEELDVKDIFVDDLGVGGGVTDRLLELGIEVSAVRVGESAQDMARYANLKAECYFELTKWLKEGGKLEEADDWYELLEVKYKENSSGLLLIEPKEELFKRGVRSYDVADALMLTMSPAFEPTIIAI